MVARTERLAAARPGSSCHLPEGTAPPDAGLGQRSRCAWCTGSCCDTAAHRPLSAHASTRKSPRTRGVLGSLRNTKQHDRDRVIAAAKR